MLDKYVAIAETIMGVIGMEKVQHLRIECDYTRKSLPVTIKISCFRDESVIAVLKASGFIYEDIGTRSLLHKQGVHVYMDLVERF